jgi:hypothetical protein
VTVKEPSRATLRKYGLSWSDWVCLRPSQGCSICEKVPKSGRLCIDHEHVRGFKGMTAAEKRKHVRGLACFRCNRYKIAANTLDSATRVVQYLRRHQERTRAVNP